jgi:hypothetical protein
MIMYCCYKTKLNCNVCDENIGVKCSKCNYYLCECCFNKWYHQNHSQNKIFNCPHCRSEKTYKWGNNKILPINLEEQVSNENRIITIFDVEKELKCECTYTIHEFNQIYNSCFLIIIMILLICLYFLITYGTCLNINKNICWYCLVLSILLPILPIITYYWNLKKKEVSENILVMFSIIESFLLIIILSKKIISCLWETEIIFMWMLLLCPCLTMLNIKSSYIKKS